MSIQQEIKSQLAKLLATEDLIVEHKQVETASFNVETRVLVLPLWEKASSEVYDMLVAHDGIFFIQPVGLPDDPDGALLGFSLTLPNTHDMRRVRLMRTAKRALDYATGVDD